MIPIYEQKLIQIEITNACINQCSNCTRFVGHHRKPFFMDMKTFKKAVESLEGFPGGIGIMGGEPTLHPKFREILAIFRRMVPDRRKRELWTAGHKWDKYKKDIEETFDSDLISYNDHSQGCGKHTPLLASVGDLVKDSRDRKYLIDNCWVQPRWSSSITPYGCYFCEIAGAMDIMLGGDNGYAIEKGWWRRKPQDFQDQVNAICNHCGAMLPIGETNDKATYDIISKGNLEILTKLKSPKIINKNYALYDKQWTRGMVEARKDWKPYQWRSFYAHNPEEVAANLGKDTDKEQGKDTKG